MSIVFTGTESRAAGSFIVGPHTSKEWREDMGNPLFWESFDDYNSDGPSTHGYFLQEELN